MDEVRKRELEREALELVNLTPEEKKNSRKRNLRFMYEPPPGYIAPNEEKDNEAENDDEKDADTNPTSTTAKKTDRYD